MRKPIRLSRSKYHARATVVDGIRFASKREAKRYGELVTLARADKVAFIELQPKFPCVVGTTLVCTYVADFRYTDRATHAVVVEDCKGFRTPIYRLKKKLVEAIYGITIKET